MVHNRENFKSINYIDHNKMNQEKDLRDRYAWEYDRFTQKMTEYQEKCHEYNEIIRYNQEVDRWQRIENETGNYYARYEAFPIGKAPAFKKNIPCIPCKPEYLEDPSTIDLYEYYDVEKFTKAWMLNVSPNWKGVAITREMIEFFEGVIHEFYGNCDRFTRMKYVLENGHGRDHLHAHIVFTLNCKKPGYMTPIKKGNILQEFRNIWNRLVKDNPSLEDLTIDDEWVDPEGTYCPKRKKKIGLIDERCALNTCLLTNIGMYKDKIDYLVEDLKPPSHKNDTHPLCPIKGSKGYD
jgi:hypothetical protein